MGSKLNNGYVGNHELTLSVLQGTTGHYQGRGVVSGARNYLEEEYKSYRNSPPRDWVRNPEWLELPDIPPGEEKVHFLIAVYDISEEEGNFQHSLIFQFQQNYSVDWGDGNTGDYGQYADAVHGYTFADIDSSTQTSEGYRQVIVTVTPQPGNQLTRFFGNETQDALGLRSQYHKKQWLDIVARLPNCDGNYFDMPYTNTVERVIIKELSVANTTSLASLFNGRTGLRYVELPDNLVNVNRVDNMFANCLRLESIPYINTSNVTNFYRFAYYCQSLKHLPKLDWSNATTVRECFSQCRNIEYYPDFNFSSGLTNCNSFMSGNHLLRELPELGDLSGVEETTSMFNSCFSIREIPDMYMPSLTFPPSMFISCFNAEKCGTITLGTACTRTDQMFYNCFSLEEIDGVTGTDNVSYARYMFRDCNRLRGVTLGDFSGLTYGEQMFYGCGELQNLPSGPSGSNFGNIPLCVNINYLFSGGGYAESMSNIDISSATVINSATFPFRSMKHISGFTGPNANFWLQYMPLTRDSVMEVFNGLPTVTGKTLNMQYVSSIMRGEVTAGDIAVATAKGWTVTT